MRQARLATASLVLLLLVAPTTIGGHGFVNGRDLAGWDGSDNPDGKQGNYAYMNFQHNAALTDFPEPEHDHFWDDRMEWTQTAKDFLLANQNRMVVIEQRIHDQDYYNYACCYLTTLPLSSAPAPEGSAEEFFQGYSEVDAEIRDTTRITVGTEYYYRTTWDSEKRGSGGFPKLYSEVEWELKTGGDIKFDVTGFLVKYVDPTFQ